MRDTKSRSFKCLYKKRINIVKYVLKTDSKFKYDQGYRISWRVTKRDIKWGKGWLKHLKSGKGVIFVYKYKIMIQNKY